jgi:tetratricopeptide (TPR) repeat protein
MEGRPTRLRKSPSLNGSQHNPLATPPLSPAAAGVAGQHPVQQCIGRLQGLFKEQTMRIGRSRLNSTMRSFSEGTSHQRKSLVSGVIHCQLRSTRRWNQELQLLIEDRARAQADKRAAIDALLAEFEAEAASLVQPYLDHRFRDAAEAESFDESSDLSTPFYASADDEVAGLALKITVLEDAVVARRATKEATLQAIFLSQLLAQFPHSTPPVSVFPQLVCSYAGCVVRVAHEPVRAGPSMSPLASPELRLALEYVGEALNVAAYPAVNDDGATETMVGPPNAAAYHGHDGRAYLETILGFLPHFPPSRGNPITNANTLFLRPEVVARHSDVVCPGAYVTNGGRDGGALRESTKRCAAALCQDTIPRLAKELVINAPADAADVVRRMHEHGVNVALMGVLLSHVPQAMKPLRRLIFTEMIARAARDHCRTVAICEANVDDMTAVISDICANVCNAETMRDTFNDVIMPIVIHKFPGTSCLIRQVIFVGTEYIDTTVFIARLAALMGVTFAEGVTANGTSSFHFTVETAHVTRRSNVPLPPPRFGKPPASGDSAAVGADPLPGVEAQAARVALYTGFDARGVAPLLLQRAMLSGKASFAYGYELFCVARAHAKLGNARQAVGCFVQAIDTLTELGRSTTLAQCLCERGRLHVDQQHFGDAMWDLNEATVNLGEVFAASPLSDEAAATVSRRQSRMSVTSERDRSFSLFNVAGGKGTGRRGSTSYGSTAAPFVVNAHAVPIFANLANLHQARGQYDEAEGHLRHILRIQKTLHGDRHTCVATALGALGYNLHQQRRFADAEQLYLEDLSITEEVNGVDDLNVVYSLNNLAVVYQQTGKYAESAELYLRDIAISTRLLGAEHANIAVTQINLAVSYIHLHKLDEAHALMRLALASRLAVHGAGSLRVAETLTNLTYLHIEQFKRDKDAAVLREAQRVGEQALAVAESHLGARHPGLQRYLENLTAVYACQGEMALLAGVSARLTQLEEAVRQRGSPSSPW